LRSHPDTSWPRMMRSVNGPRGKAGRTTWVGTAARFTPKARRTTR